MSSNSFCSKLLSSFLLFSALVTLAASLPILNPNTSLDKRTGINSMARLWWTSVDDNNRGTTFLNLQNESTCYRSCNMDGLGAGTTSFSYSWSQDYKTCWCRPIGLKEYLPLRSPLSYPAVNIASTIKRTCAQIAMNPLWKDIPCENVRMTKSGLKLVNGGTMRALGDGMLFAEVWDQSLH